MTEATDVSTTAQCGAGEALLPCPFCGKPLFVSSRPINPKAYCRTEDCYGKKMPCVNLDVPSDVAAWNARSTPPSPVRAAQEDEEALQQTVVRSLKRAYDRFQAVGRDRSTEERWRDMADAAIDAVRLSTPQDNPQQKGEG